MSLPIALELPLPWQPGIPTLVLIYVTACTLGCSTKSEKSAPAPATPIASPNSERITATKAESETKPTAPPENPASPHVEPQTTPANTAADAPAPMAGEAANQLPIALYLANQDQYVDRKLRFRVTAESGNYFNCYYKGRRQSYHHLRLRGDGSAYLDGYLPRDPAGERLFTELQKRRRQITVTVIARAATKSSVCAGQVEIIDFEKGFKFTPADTGTPGALRRRIANQKDKEPARNRPRIAHYLEQRQSYIDSPRTFRVRARLDRYYQCKYSSAQSTHYALFLQGDGFKGLRAYLPRDKDSNALAEWLASNEGAKLTVTVTVEKQRYDQLCPDQVEVLSWQKGWPSRR